MQWRRRSFYLASAFVLALLAASTVPWIQAELRRRVHARCDLNYVALTADAANALDASLRPGRPTHPCARESAEAIVHCLVEAQEGARNPLDRSQPAYTINEPASCQVQVYAFNWEEVRPGEMYTETLSDGANAIGFRQRAHPSYDWVRDTRDWARHE